MMTTTVSEILKLITDKGYPITTAASLDAKKSPGSVGALTRGQV